MEVKDSNGGLRRIQDYGWGRNGRRILYQLTYNSFFIWPVLRSPLCSLARLLAICKMKLQRWNNSRNIYVLENVKSCTTCTAQHSSVQCCGGECLWSDISISSGYEVSDTPISRYHFNINIMLDTISISAAGTHCPLHLHHTSGAGLQQKFPAYFDHFLFWTDCEIHKYQILRGCSLNYDRQTTLGMHALGKSLIIVWVACVYKICWRLCL